MGNNGPAPHNHGQGHQGLPARVHLHHGSPGVQFNGHLGFGLRIRNMFVGDYSARALLGPMFAKHSLAGARQVWAY